MSRSFFLEEDRKGSFIDLTGGHRRDSAASRDTGRTTDDGGRRAPGLFQGVCSVAFISNSHRGRTCGLLRANRLLRIFISLFLTQVFMKLTIHMYFTLLILIDNNVAISTSLAVPSWGHCTCCAFIKHSRFCELLRMIFRNLQIEIFC